MTNNWVLLHMPTNPAKNGGCMFIDDVPESAFSPVTQVGGLATALTSLGYYKHAEDGGLIMLTGFPPPAGAAGGAPAPAAAAAPAAVAAPAAPAGGAPASGGKVSDMGPPRPMGGGGGKMPSSPAAGGSRVHPYGRPAAAAPAKVAGDGGMPEDSEETQDPTWDANMETQPLELFDASKFCPQVGTYLNAAKVKVAFGGQFADREIVDLPSGDYCYWAKPNFYYEVVELRTDFLVHMENKIARQVAAGGDEPFAYLKNLYVEIPPNALAITNYLALKGGKIAEINYRGGKRRVVVSYESMAFVGRFVDSNDRSRVVNVTLTPGHFE